MWGGSLDTSRMSLYRHILSLLPFILSCLFPLPLLSLFCLSLSLFFSVYSSLPLNLSLPLSLPLSLCLSVSPPLFMGGELRPWAGHSPGGGIHSRSEVCCGILMRSNQERRGEEKRGEERRGEERRGEER